MFDCGKNIQHVFGYFGIIEGILISFSESTDKAAMFIFMHLGVRDNTGKIINLDSSSISML